MLACGILKGVLVETKVLYLVKKSTLFGKEIAQSTMLCKKVMNELTELVDNALSSIVVYT